MGAPTQVLIVELEPDFVQGCKNCRRSFLEHSGANLAIGLIIKEKDGEYRYFLGTEAPVVKCCGEEKTLVEVFVDNESAEARQNEVIAYLNQRGSTEGLNLKAFAFELPKNEIN